MMAARDGTARRATQSRAKAASVQTAGAQHEYEAEVRRRRAIHEILPCTESAADFITFVSDDRSHKSLRLIMAPPSNSRNVRLVRVSCSKRTILESRISQL